ncbi:hypothetical protein ACWD6I_16665 [Streptomyces sp. NPDC002454]|jgi:hypothetical protein|uniref:hypothetical protein n=1 Tax=Streptomyces sp. NPDC049906 TaxID=3155656 RepID=UPI003413F3E8
MELLIALLLVVLFVAVGGYAAVKVVGAAKRSVDRTIHQARRRVEDTTLKAKTYTQVGPAGELAQLRLTLRTSMRVTQDALQAGVAEDESLKESLALFERLSVHGQELDRELKRLEAEPDRTQLTTVLPELRRRTDQITESADALRWAARERAHRFAHDDLDTLSQQIGMESDALRHWTSAPAADAPFSWSEPPAAPEPEPARREPRPEEQQQASSRPAIAPTGPQPSRPWEKKQPRPESTT